MESALPTIQKKTCGNCARAESYERKGGVPIKTHVLCTVYTARKERLEKACHNWREKEKNEVRT